MQKFVSFAAHGARTDAVEINNKLPPGAIMPDMEKDERDAQLVGEMHTAGSRCTAACTSEFNAEGLKQYALAVLASALQCPAVPCTAYLKLRVTAC